jgi:hypothetical protein
MNRFLRHTTGFVCSVALALGLVFGAQAGPSKGLAPASTEISANPAPSISALKHSYSAERYAAHFKHLSSEDQAHFRRLHKRAGAAERAHLERALAAGHSVRVIEQLAGKIHGKDEAWLRDVLRLTSGTTWRGVQQQWKHSCGPTTVMAFLAELDPVYAYRVHAENPQFYKVDDTNALRFNPRLAEEQRRMLERRTTHESAGKAVSRSAPGGEGRWILDLLNEHTSHTGLAFTWRQIGPSMTTAQALKAMEPALSRHIPIPLVIESGTNSHCVLITGIWHKDGHVGYNIHDPWTGTTISRTADQFLQGTLNIAGNHKLQSIYLPTIKSMI